MDNLEKMIQENENIEADLLAEMNDIPMEEESKVED